MGRHSKARIPLPAPDCGPATGMGRSRFGAALSRHHRLRGALRRTHFCPRCAALLLAVHRRPCRDSDQLARPIACVPHERLQGWFVAGPHEWGRAGRCTSRCRRWAPGSRNAKPRVRPAMPVRPVDVPSRQAGRQAGKQTSQPPLTAPQGHAGSQPAPEAPVSSLESGTSPPAPATKRWNAGRQHRAIGRGCEALDAAQQGAAGAPKGEKKCVGPTCRTDAARACSCRKLSGSPSDAKADASCTARRVSVPAALRQGAHEQQGGAPAEQTGEAGLPSTNQQGLETMAEHACHSENALAAHTQQAEGPHKVGLPCQLHRSRTGNKLLDG